MDRDRMRRIRNWQSDDWYPALVMRPLCILLMLVIADWRWITANGLTTLANLCKVAAAALIVPGWGDAVGLGDGASVVLAVVLIQLGALFDHLDGTVARYRRTFSAFGSFYDKTGDMITWFFISAAIGWRAFAGTGDALLIVLPIAAAYALAVRGYMKWLIVAESEKLRWHEASRSPAELVAQHTAPATLGEPPDRTPADWLRWFLRMSVQFYRFEEMDLFFWIAIGLLTGQLKLLCWLLFVSQTIGLVGMVIRRAREAHRIDASLAPYRR
jgi:phosphatidylglycerophosphate synthase